MGMEQFSGMEMAELGTPSVGGNVVGIQPWMRLEDYLSEAAFYARLAGYFQGAQQKGWMRENTILVLPEYLGTWLVVADERPEIARATTVTEAMQQLAFSHLVPFAREALLGKEKDRVAASLFRIKAAKMAAIYQTVFSRLAREYQVTVVAGSILLPAPVVDQGVVHAGKGPLYNVTAVYRPDGLAEPALVKKVYPIASELPFVAQALVADLPVFDTPAGRLGVLICADSWFPEAYQKIRQLGVDILVVPSAILPGKGWEQLPWHGYSGYAAPADVNVAQDVDQISEAQAWDRYALEGRFAQSGARYGMNLFFYGDLLDLSPCNGRWKMIAGDVVLKGRQDSAALINLWL
jgi:predicted amidohydrolase